MIIDHCRDFKELEDLYNSVDRSNLPKLKDIVALRDYAFYFYEDSGKLIGVIYLEGKNNNVFLSGFSKRKHIKEKIEALNIICNHFTEDIYSQTPFRHAEILLKKAGFKHLKDDIYIRKAR